MAEILTGELFAEMIISGANNLYNNRSEVDDLNVFPVPDGDTGTNMSLTVTAMANDLKAKASGSLSKTADVMSFSTLRGARGNSGVILSQFFRGISKSLKGKDECSAEEFAAALTDGAGAAYKAVMKPTEGTILTVAREAANGASIAASASKDLCEVLSNAVQRGNKALAHTPEQLPALKKAGVVDAGGKGWMLVLEGALYYLENGSSIEREDDKSESAPQPPQKAQAALNTEDIKFKYCTEFIIEKYKSGASVDEFRSAIAQKGDCMLVIDDDDVVKVHIHTNHPGFVLEEAVKLGEMINLKIDNMKHQHRTLLSANEVKEEAPQKPEKPKKQKAASEKKEKKPVEIKEYGFVAIAAGKGFAAILKDLGADKIIEGGQTMNPSTEDIIKAVKRIKARVVFVFPNNKNIIMAATQAAEIIEDKRVIVIPTRSVPECIASLIAFDARKTTAGNEETMNKSMKKIRSASITYAVRDTEIDDIEIKKDDILGIDGSDITMVGKGIDEVLEKLVDSIVDEDTEYVTLYYGKDVKKADAEAAAARLEEKYSEDEIEVTAKRGGQPVYYYVLGVE
ncbi:MAG: DAK2 domain-containing protein [Clostridia bacterium]|nr:DAK2 domain-containing protein [Clostridia bacterium]